MWDRRLPFFFEIEIPNVTIDQRDDEGRAQERGSRADMRAQLERHSVHPHRGVERKREAEEPEKETEPHAGAPLQQTADRQRNKKCPDEYNHRDPGRISGLEQSAKHLLRLYQRNRPPKQVLSCGGKRVACETVTEQSPRHETSPFDWQTRLPLQFRHNNQPRPTGEE